MVFLPYINQIHECEVEELFTSRTTKLTHVGWPFSQWSHFHGPIYEQCISVNPLGLPLGVNRMWIKRNDHAPKSGRADFLNLCLKMAVLGFCFFVFDLLPFFPLNYSDVWHIYIITYMCHGPLTFVVRK